MSTYIPATTTGHEPPGDDLRAMADVERRALRSELTLAQLRHEVQALRERLAIDAAVVARWAAARYNAAALQHP